MVLIQKISDWSESSSKFETKTPPLEQFSCQMWGRISPKLGCL
jgi:hypothetical protein